MGKIQLLLLLLLGPMLFMGCEEGYNRTYRFDYLTSQQRKVIPYVENQKLRFIRKTASDSGIRELWCQKLESAFEDDGRGHIGETHWDEIRTATLVDEGGKTVFSIRLSAGKTYHRHSSTDFYIGTPRLYAGTAYTRLVSDTTQTGIHYFTDADKPDTVQLGYSLRYGLEYFKSATLAEEWQLIR